jgi:hypothetical protein
MSPSLRRVGAMFFLATSAAVFAPACAANESSIYVRALMSTPTDTCLVEADPSGAQLSSGVLDVSFQSALASGYSGALLVANQLVRRGDPDLLRTETSKLQIYGADITIRNTSDDVLTRSGGGEAEFFTPVSGFADASSGTTAGLGIVFVNMIDAGLASDLRAQVLASGRDQTVVVDVIIHGRTLGGAELTSWDWYFPIRVCVGCLCGCSTDEMNCHPGVDAPTCGQLDPTTKFCVPLMM